MARTQRSVSACRPVRGVYIVPARRPKATIAFRKTLPFRTACSNGQRPPCSTGDRLIPVDRSTRGLYCRTHAHSRASRSIGAAANACDIKGATNAEPPQEILGQQRPRSPKDTAFVDAANAMEAQTKALTDDQLRAKTVEFVSACAIR